MNVLIIDDDISFAKLLERRLKSFLKDMSLQHLKTLTEARTYLEKRDTPLDLVIIDEHLPDGRGVDFIAEGWFRDIGVLSVSSDDAPEIPGSALGAGASYFLNKRNISEPLFQPLVQGVIDRNRLQQELNVMKVQAAIVESVKTLVGTLKHEINNPLGAVLGAAYLIKQVPGATQDQKDAADLVETSGQRIKHVVEQLTKAMELQPIKKAHQLVYHIPGDAPWESGEDK